MFNSLEAIVSGIALNISGGKETDDSLLNHEYIADLVHAERASIINLIKNRPSIQTDFYQEICCLEIKCDTTNCTPYSDVGTPYIEIPALAESLGGRVIKSLRVGDKEYYNARVYRNNKHTYKVKGSKIELNYVAPGAKFVCLEAVFYNPTKAALICGEEKEIPYACPSEYISQIAIRVEARLRQMRGMPIDNRNNANAQ